MRQHSFRKLVFTRMAKQQKQSGHSTAYGKYVLLLSLTVALLLSFLFLTSQNISAHTTDVNRDFDMALRLSTGENNQLTNTGVIGNRVWYDANGNGLQDPGEPGVADVLVTLYNAANDAVVATTTTGSDGSYTFTGLEAGRYYVGFTLPAQRIFTTGNVDGADINGPLNSDVTLPGGLTEAFALGADETNLNVDAGLLPGCYSFRWDELSPPFENGNSSLQTFTDIQGLGVNMTVEVRVYDAAFNDIGLYVAPPGQEFPRVEGTAFSTRDINSTTHPNAGMIIAKVIFSEPITINGLWLEPFYFWTDHNVRKMMAIQAFDPDGNGVVPGGFTMYGGSDLVAELRPDNNKLWLVADFPNTQTVYSGASGINYGAQPIQEIDWFSWAEPPDRLSFSHTIGSSYFGSFLFCRISPTAVSLVDFQTSSKPVVPWAAGLVALVFMTGLALTVRRRREGNS
jgi:hypothetical protein